MFAFGLGREGIERPSIGVISRIYRPSSKTVMVDLEKFGKSAEPVLVTRDLSRVEAPDRNPKPTIRAILVHYDSGKRICCCPPIPDYGKEASR